MASVAANTAVKERRAGGNAALERFVSDRAEMLSLYWRVAGIDSAAPADDGRQANESTTTAVADLRRFCESLVDYIASGHFILYERIACGQERRRGVAELADSLYPRIAGLTEVAIRFNDKYDALLNKSTASIDTSMFDSYEADLSRLGEALAVRIELEDELISKLRGGRD